MESRSCGMKSTSSQRRAVGMVIALLRSVHSEWPECVGCFCVSVCNMRTANAVKRSNGLEWTEQGLKCSVAAAAAATSPKETAEDAGKWVGGGVHRLAQYAHGMGLLQQL